MKKNKDDVVNRETPAQSAEENKKKAIEKWKCLDKQYRKAFAEAAGACRQACSLGSEARMRVHNEHGFASIDSRIRKIRDVNLRREAWDKAHSAWEVTLKLARKTLAAWKEKETLYNDHGYLLRATKEKPNVDKVEENVRRTQETVDLANRVIEYLSRGAYDTLSFNIDEATRVLRDFDSKETFADVRLGLSSDMYSIL
ncbi:hypothetical protein AGMMS49592_6340 [Endomicrobiia bacterium]|nr:hypothetical protein AGMMS49592_6340 [Endomicrobiia bacterium]